jgi:hypothetical protein
MKGQLRICIITSYERKKGGDPDIYRLSIPGEDKEELVIIISYGEGFLSSARPCQKAGRD